MSEGKTTARKDVRRVLLPNLVLAASIALTLVAAYFVSSIALAKDRIRLDMATRYVGDTIEDRMGIYVALLRSSGGLFDSSDVVTAKSFRSFVEAMRIGERYPGIRSIGFVERMRSGSAEDAVRIAAERDVPKLEVTPTTGLPDAYPIVFVESIDGEQQANVGFDMSSEEIRRTTMDAARDSGAVVMSPRLTLLSDLNKGNRPAFVLFCPVYRRGSSVATVDDRRANIAGFVVAAFRTLDLFDKLFTEGGASTLVDFRVYDGPASTPEHLVYDSALAGGDGSAGSTSRVSASRTVPMPGREWTVAYVTRPSFERGSSRDLALWTLLVGLGVSGLLFLVSRAQVKARTDAEGYAEELLSSRERLRLSEARLRRFADSDLMGIEILDSTGRLVEANDAFLGLLGYARDELPAGGLDWSTIKPAERESVDKAVLHSMTSGGENVTYETEYLRRDGSTVPVLEGLAGFEGPEGSIIGFTLDLSEQKRVESERLALLDREREARQLAEEANRLKDEFLATVSHELRTPLNAILGWARLLAMGRLDAPTAASALDTIERNAKTQAQLIEDLLDVSRIISGKLRLTVEPVDLVPVISSALDAVRPAARAKSITIETDIDQATGAISGDATRLQQVVWNLLSNAVKFTPRGGTVRVSLAAADTYAKLEVTDTGPGIDQAFLPYVFERFRQADSSITRAHGGLGLGLAIVRHLTEMHGGSVSADSEGEGTGATFTVRLPLMGVRIDEPSGVRADGIDLSLGGIRVLVVDDDADSRDVLAMSLGQFGAEVRTCENGEQALEDLSIWEPDVLISDIAMPGMNGHELIRRIRERGPADGGTIPAIALSAYSRGDDQKKSIASGYQVHLTKPFDPKAVATEVERLAAREKRLVD